MATSDSTAKPARVKDETGNVYGKLTVVSFAEMGPSTNKGARWLCRCECGNVVTIAGANLRAGRTTSCGCSHASIGGMSNRPEYHVWHDMKRRCYDSRRSDYKHYGGRGITVCDRWRESFLAFWEDMGPRPFAGATVERKNNDGQYSPENCCWATQEEQKQNSRNVRRLTYNGETMGISAWARKLGIHRCTLRLRLDKGWPLDEVFSSETSFINRRFRV